MATIIQEQDVDVTELMNMIPRDLVPCIKSFMKMEYDYALYDEKYTWESIEEILNNVLHWGPDFCCHLFKKFEEIGNGLQLFYPNADTDTELTLRRRTWYDEPEIGVSFHKTEWFTPDYIKMPGGGKRWYNDDDGTNYKDMAKMITIVLRKFDEWYWNNYSATAVDHEILTHIVKVYDTLEKYAHMDDDEFENDDNSIEESWKPWALLKNGIQ
jgi:hypothetical protein